MSNQPLRIALTFDDGPNTTITPQVLDLLEEHGIVASFFLIAQNITPESALQARRAYDMGCTIENHSVTHREMDKLSPEEIREEIRVCTEKIVEITGEEPKFFRPPYIAVNQTLFDNVDLTFICGSGCEDWVPTVSAEERARRVLANAKDGEIVLLHDKILRTIFRQYLYQLKNKKHHKYHKHSQIYAQIQHTNKYSHYSNY